MNVSAVRRGATVLVCAVMSCFVARCAVGGPEGPADAYSPATEVPSSDAYDPSAQSMDDSTGTGQPVSGTAGEECPSYDEYMTRQAYRWPTGPEYCRAMRVFRSPILGRLWVQGEALLWTPKGVQPPALASGSTLDAPADTAVLFGERGVFQEMSGGGRITGGFWWTPVRCAGIQASYFEVDGHDREFHAVGDDRTILLRPLVDARDGLPGDVLTAYPGVMEGAIDAWADTELSGAECLWRRMLACQPGFRLDFMAGYRYGRLYDRLLTQEHMLSLDPVSGWAAGTEIWREDLFRTVNEFHGGELGLLARWQRGCWALDVTGKVALGGTATTTTIEGATTTLETINDADLLTFYDGGVLALPTNMGRYREGRFTVLSELEVALRRELLCNLWFRIGYNLFGWSRVGRAADQVDTGVNPTQIPPGALVGDARPAFVPQTSTFWAQGLSLGLEYQF